MEYPVPIATAGRAALIILNLAFIRVEGVSRLKRLIAFRPDPGLWLDDFGHYGVRQSFLRRAPAVGSCCLSLLTLTIAVAWSGCELILLANDFVADPFSTSLGLLVALIGWETWQGAVTSDSLYEKWTEQWNKLLLKGLDTLDRTDAMSLHSNELDRSALQSGQAATAVNQLLLPMLSEPVLSVESDAHLFEGQVKLSE